MPQTTRTTKAATITRRIELSLRMDMTTQACVTETTHLKTKDNTVITLYTLTRIDTDFGVGVEVTKQFSEDGEVYHVHLDKTLGDSCTCPAGVYKGACRHLDMTREAVRRGLV